MRVEPTCLIVMSEPMSETMSSITVAMTIAIAEAVDLAVTVGVMGVTHTVVVLVATSVATMVGDGVARSVVVVDAMTEAGMGGSCHGNANNEEEDDGSLHGGCGCDGRSKCEVG